MSTDSRAFVGRDRELAELEAHLVAAAVGHGGLVLLGGEPGIGKTRLLDELAARARRRGVAVCWSRCWEAGGAPPYWLWVQVVRAQERAGTTGRQAEALGCASGLATLASALPARGAHMPLVVAAEVESEQARFALFDAVAGWLRTVAGRTPLLLLIDDVHAADVPSLRLLAFVARELRGAPLLIVCAHRDVDAGASPAVHDALADCALEGVVVSLAGLAERDVARFVQARTGVEAPAPLVAALHRQTGGNPFFLDELVRLLGADGGLDAGGVALERVPARIQDAIERRVAPLSSRCRTVLEMASVLGLECTSRRLAAVAGTTPAAVMSDLQPAVTSGIVTVGVGPTVRVRFRHALFREALYHGLAPARRAALHGDVGRVLQDDAEAPVAELAHHFLEAAEGGADVERAVEHARRAAVEATARMAHEDAVALYERALETLALSDRPLASLHCALLVELGESRQRLGVGGGARTAFEHALAMAPQLDEPAQVVARATLGIAGIGPEIGRVDGGVVQLLDDALDALDPMDPLRARVMARLAAELTYSPHADRRDTLSRESVVLAERLGEPATLGYVLARRHVVLLGPGSVPERRELASVVLELACRVGDRELEAEGRGWRVAANLELGEIAAVDRDLDALAQRAAETRHPHYLWLAAMFRAMRAILAARFGDGERLAQEALAIGQRSGDPNALLAYGAQLVVLRRGQGRLAEIAPLLQQMTAGRDSAPIWESATVHLHAMVGNLDEARARFVPAYEVFRDHPRDVTWLLHLGLLGEVCAVVGDRPRGEVLHELLQPYADRQLVAGPGAVCLGAVVRVSGLLAALLERWDESLSQLERAAQLNDAMGALAWGAETACDQAAVYLERDASGDRDAARSCLARARTLAHRLDLGFVTQRVAALDHRLGDDTPGERTVSGRQVFRREGDHWRVEFAGRACRLRDSKGVRLLVELLRRPGVECHVAVLVAMVDGRDPVPDPDTLSMAESERHRVSVTRTVHAVLDRLGRSLPALDEHLARTLHTGTRCKYDPDPRAPACWEF